MTTSSTSKQAFLVLTLLSGLVASGCGVLGGGDVLEDLEDLELRIDRSVNIIQEDDPRRVAPPAGFVDRGDTVIIADDVDIIVDVSEDLVVEELPDITLVGLENLTGYDIYVTYAVDGDVQGALVYEGETLLLEYFCLEVIELILEEDFDPVTGLFVDEFDLGNAEFINPFDFECGEALIITFDPVEVIAVPERIDLVY
jgi:hypothetical protein